MLVAVTGANGFLGSRTVEVLHRAGHRVRALVLARDRCDPIAAFVDEWEIGDQGDQNAVAGFVAGADAIMHLAIDWTALNAGAIPNIERNLVSSLRLLEAARVAQVRQFQFVSSLDVYHDPDPPIDERQPARPGSLYGALKASIEVHLLAYHFSHGMNTSAWRPATMYGIHRDLHRSHWFELVGQVMRGENIATDLAGSVVCVQDVADALVLALGDASVAGQVYNLADSYFTWESVAGLAGALRDSNSSSQGTRSDPVFDTRKAIGFFERHENTIALRRGVDGVRAYLSALLQRAGDG